ncbi:hypothetical protein EVA_08555 [gut metagenome]|uniref:Uncharacterized protein n=1 Tax=gut metagenome TaxID=749906 RepID=J9G904_9ZZZZ
MLFWNVEFFVKAYQDTLTLNCQKGIVITKKTFGSRSFRIGKKLTGGFL